MKSGFTLIELLVVITIIVVLLAMLAPALDKAMYQTKLAVCAAQERTVMAGLHQYAFDHKRHYPHKTAVQAPVWYPPDYMAAGDHDYRPLIEDYITYRRLYVDPMAGYVDLSPEATDSDGAVLSSYFHYDGYQFYAPATSLTDRKSSAAGQGMTKIGNRMIWRERRNNQFIDHRFNLLITDKNHHVGNPAVFNGHAIMSHPDRDGIGELSDRQNIGLGPEGAPTGAASWKGTYSHWNYFNLNTRTHGSVDLNFGFQDGSVRQINNLERPPVSTPTAKGTYPLTPTPGINEADSVSDPNGGYNWILEGD